MGQGGYLWIVNATTKELKLTHEHSYQMNSWSFSDIAANVRKRFYIEFDQGVFHTVTDDAGEADFQLEGTSTSFQLQVRWFRDTGRFLRVDWSGTSTSEFTVFPPPLSGTTGELGWIHNGDLCMLIQEKGTTLSSEILAPISTSARVETQLIVPPEVARDALSSLTGIPTASIGDDVTTAMAKRMASSAHLTEAPRTGLGTQWMKYYGDTLGSLTLTEMTLPGTHDSGTYQPVSPFGRPWVQTQSISLREQLNLGIRVLDLRIGQNSPGNYIISHGDWRTHYSLCEALQEVKEFICATDMEIVILDFHRFNALSSEDFDYDQLKEQVQALLQDYYLPVGEGKGKSLNEIWQRPASERERIVIAWNSNTIDTSYMWPGVNQHWYSNANNIDKLYSDIESDFSHPPPSTEMWSTCVFATVGVIDTPRVNAEELRPTIDTWFYGCATWTLKANIITTDFFQLYNNSVQASICANILKAGLKNHN